MDGIKKKYLTDSTNQDVYKHYKKEFEGQLTLKTFNDIWVDYIYAGTELSKEKKIKGILYKMIFENYEVIFPFRMGTLRIKKKKIKVKLNKEGKVDYKRMAIDWDETRKMWKEDPIAKQNKNLLFYTNMHSQGYRMSWFWNKKDCLFKNMSYYIINMNRTIDRYLARTLKDKQYSLEFYL